MLYRLLIEIRRKKDIQWIPDPTISISPARISDRNNCRSLCVEWRVDKCNAFSKDTARFGFNCEADGKRQCVGQTTEKGMAILMYCSSYNSYSDIGMFHELCHWYHFLRNPCRYLNERTASNSTVRLNGTDIRDSMRIPIGQYFWRHQIAVNNNRWKVSALPWIDSEGGWHVHFEEIRNILGVKKNISDYMEGDDLSENLYRISIGQPIRFGHSEYAYYEDKDIIQDVINNYISIISDYDVSFDISEFVIPRIFSIIPKKLSEELLIGLGDCKHPKTDVFLQDILPN